MSAHGAPAPGKVYLVGSGPGDPDLLTVKARRLLDTADVVLHDYLTGSRVVDTIPPGTRVIDVGKPPGDSGERTPQAAIDRLLVEHARAGRTVVRLKGGDATVFGRGGEEAQHLAAEGIPFEFVPGVTSVVAAPAAAGIPLTHRELSSTLTVITGHEDPTKRETAIDWAALAETVAAGGTLVVLMGVGTLAENVAVLREEGLPADTPVAMVEKATWADETTVVGTLESIVDQARDAGVSPPACTIVGDVVSVHAEVAESLVRDTTARAPPAQQPARGIRSDGGTDPVDGRPGTDTAASAPEAGADARGDEPAGPGDADRP